MEPTRQELEDFVGGYAAGILMAKKVLEKAAARGAQISTMELLVLAKVIAEPPGVRFMSDLFKAHRREGVDHIELTDDRT